MKQIIKTIAVLIIINYTLSANIIDKTSNSVVKIFSTKLIPNYKYPWQTGKIARYTGSGAVISNNRILTAAHVVSKSKLLEVTKENDTKKYIAHVQYISHQADLAILTVDNKSFFDNTKPLKLSTNIKIRDNVHVVGYPIGGKNISITTGVVSRIEQVYYSYSREKLLAIQVDAAINSGNSGGPTVNDKNELVGIAMMKRLNASNIAYIVPTDIINAFLVDVKDKKVDGFSQVDNSFEQIQNETLKEYFNLKDNGVLITSTDYNEKDLKVNDILIAIDNKLVSNTGTIKSKYGKIGLSHIVDTKQIGDIVKLDIIRDKKKIKIPYTVKNAKKLIEYEFDKAPRYIIFGGLIFTPITKNYLYKIPKTESSLIAKKLYKKKVTPEYKEAITIINTTFATEENRGYSTWANILKSVNGINIKSLNHLISILDTTKEKYTKFKFNDNSLIVLNTKKARESFDKIKNIYRLSSDRNN